MSKEGDIKRAINDILLEDKQIKPSFWVSPVPIWLFLISMAISLGINLIYLYCLFF